MFRGTMIRRLRYLLIASCIFLAGVACDGLTIETATRTAADTSADVTAVCGNGEIEADEGCDDGNEVTEPCAYGRSSCNVCNATCQVEAGLVSYCGDAFVDRSEQCDEGSGTETNGCTSSCLCSNTYHLEGGACVSDTRNCSPLPANTTKGTQTWNSATGAYGSCTASG